ncbi:MAG: hypothetical protein WDO24_21485 [Pseudomonadota bacterium]
MRRLGRGLAACALIALSIGAGTGPSRADGYPDKPVRVIVPFPPGGAAYVSPFLLAKYLTDTLGQNFLMDPRPGGNTIIARAWRRPRVPMDIRCSRHRTRP